MKRFLFILCALCIISSHSCYDAKKDDALGNLSAQELYDKAYQSIAKEERKEAIRILNDLCMLYPYADIAEDARMNIIQILDKKKDYAELLVALDEFVDRHPHSAKLDFIYYMKSMTYNNISKKEIDRDLSELILSYDNSKYFIARFPESQHLGDMKKLLDVAVQKLFDHEIYVHGFYMRQKKYNAAFSRLCHAKSHYSGDISKKSVDDLDKKMQYIKEAFGDENLECDL